MLVRTADFGQTPNLDMAAGGAVAAGEAASGASMWSSIGIGVLTGLLIWGAQLTIEKMLGWRR